MLISRNFFRNIEKRNILTYLNASDLFAVVSLGNDKDDSGAFGVVNGSGATFVIANVFWAAFLGINESGVAFIVANYS